MTLDATTGEVVALAVPLTLSAAETSAYMDAYEDVCRRILKAEDIQRIGHSEFIKRSGWRKLGVWAMVSAEILEGLEVRDDAGALVRARFKVRASAPNGRFMDGIGVCDRSERMFTKPEHDIVATAHTRAINRAFADLFGLGAVTAEEVSAERPAGVDDGAFRRAVQDLYGRIRAGDPADKREFQTWCHEHLGYAWPPKTWEHLEEMVAEWDALQTNDADQYGVGEDS